MENNNTNNNVDNNEEISLLELWKIFKNHFGFFILTVVFVLAIAFLYLEKTVPIYSSNVTVLVDPIQSSSSLDDMLSMSTGSSSEISTEVELIKSEKNVQSALDSMDLSIYLNSEGIPFNSFYSLKNALGSLTVSSVTDTNIVTISIENENPKFAADLANAIAKNYDILLTGIAKNSKTVQREFLEKQIPLNEAQLKEASNKLSDFREQSGIMQLNEKASSLVNQIAFFDLNKEPLKLNKESNKEKLDKYLEEFDSYSIKVPTVEEIEENKNLKPLIKTYVIANDKLLMYNLAYSTDLSNSKENSSTVSSKTSLLNNTLNSTSNKMLNQINSILCEYKNNNYQVNELLSNFSKLVMDIIKTDIELNALDARSQVYNDQLDQLPIIERQVTELSRNVTVLQQVGLELRSMLEQTKLTEAAVSGNVTVIDAAKIPTIPVSPNKLLIMAVALLLGMALGFLVCIILHLQQSTIETRADLKAILGEKYRMLGWIPLIESKQPIKNILNIGNSNKEETKQFRKSIPVYDMPTSLQAEKYMNITSNIIYGDFLKQNKVMTITSCDISAGKSSIIANVGICLAKMGLKVIVIDGDFRMPSSLTNFGYSQAKKGSVEVIMGKERLEDVIIQPLKDVPNYLILPVGHKPLVPSSILAHPYFKEMIQILKGSFDYVLIDTPPLDYASEVLAIGKISDSILLAARANVTSKEAFKDLIESLTPVQDKIIGAVLNGFVPSTADFGGSNAGKYGYGKKYGYGYGYSVTESRYDAYTNTKSHKRFKIHSAAAAMKKEKKLYETNLKNRNSRISGINKLHNIPPVAPSLDFGLAAEEFYNRISENSIIKTTKLYNSQKAQEIKNRKFANVINELKKDNDATGKDSKKDK